MIMIQRRKRSSALIAVVCMLMVSLCTLSCATLGGQSDMQEALVVGVATQQLAMDAYTAVRIAWHEGEISNANMLKADELYLQFWAAHLAYKSVLTLAESVGEKPSAEVFATELLQTGAAVVSFAAAMGVSF